MRTLMGDHSGLVVSDIASAAEHLTAMLGCSLDPPTRLTAHEVENSTSAVAGPVALSVTHSSNGPFRLELIEATGDGLYSAARGGLHHLGVWEPDVDRRRRQQLKASGEPIDAILPRPDGSISVTFAGATKASGTRIEYLSEAQRKRLDQWFEAGVFA